MGYSCEKTDHVFGEVCGRTLEIWDSKPIGVDEPLDLSTGAWEIRMLVAMQMKESWIVTFQREEKTLLGHLS